MIVEFLIVDGQAPYAYYTALLSMELEQTETTRGIV